jgi:hypothetical protein
MANDLVCSIESQDSVCLELHHNGQYTKIHITVLSGGVSADMLTQGGGGEAIPYNIGYFSNGIQLTRWLINDNIEQREQVLPKEYTEGHLIGLMGQLNTQIVPH